MKRLLLACALALAWPAHADEPEAAPAVPQGYAFDQPELLADQLVWGVAHGVRLLALACARADKQAAAEAWVNWQERERASILAAGRTLGLHYFGREDAPPDAIAGVLGLQSNLALPPEQLAPACATLAEALAQPRYELARRRDELLMKQKTEPKR